MKALRLNNERTGLSLQETALPIVERHDVLVKVHAASLNFRDQAVLQGGYKGPVVDNVVPLSDGAGEVVAVGSAVTRAKVGDRITAACTPHWIGGRYLPEYQASSFGWTIDGWLAEFVRVPENGIVHVPDYLSYVEAATLPCAAVSAWEALHVGSPLRPGQTVLIQGTGGVSLFGLQIARMFGARVLAITSSEMKAERLRTLGAEAVIIYRDTPDWELGILELTGGRGVDKVVEIAGGETIVKSAAATRKGGDIGLVGFVDGFDGGLPSISILGRQLNISGLAIGPRTSFEALMDAMAATQANPIIDQIVTFEQHEEAYRRLASGAHVGKVVLTFPA